MGVISASEGQFRREDCVRDRFDWLTVESLKNSVQASMGVRIVAQRIADAHYRVKGAAIRPLIKFLNGTYPGCCDALAFDHESVHDVPAVSKPGPC